MVNCLGSGGLDSWDFFEVGIAMKVVPRFESQTTTIPNHQPEPLVPKNPEPSLGGLGLIVPILSPDLFDLHLHPRSFKMVVGFNGVFFLLGLGLSLVEQ